MAKEIEKIKSKIVEVLKKNGVVKAGIFGSYARGEQKQSSDIDLVIEVNGSLLDVIRIEREIKQKLRRKIDVLTYGAISPYLKERILKEQIRIL